MPKEEVKEKKEVGLFDRYRAQCAYILMLFLVVFTTIGAGLIFLPAGFITFGILSGVVGYILGAE
jgi:hypothetical protein